jgi:adenylylsulfate kinase
MSEIDHLDASRQQADGLVVWLTGLPAAGKTTTAELVATELRRAGRRASVIDGDAFRAAHAPARGFSPADRAVNVRAIVEAAARERRDGTIVLVAVVSPYRWLRAEARDRLAPGFLEVHVRAPLAECVRRDPKGLYRRAIAGEMKAFTGISDVYESPEQPELVLDTLAMTPAECATSLLASIAAASGGGLTDLGGLATLAG